MNKSITAIALVVAVASGCAFGDSGSEGFAEVGTAGQSVTTTSGRTIPYPIVRKVDGSGTIVDDIDPTTGTPRQAWDASYSELLIADEYAKCVAQVAGTSVPSFVGAANYPRMPEAGAALARAAAAIDSGPCPSSDYSPTPSDFPPTALEWAHRRQDVNCNIEPTTNKRVAAFELPQPDPESPVVAFGADWTVPGFTFGSFFTTPYTSYAALYHSLVGLCFAQRLNEVLEGPEVFTATTQEHMLLLGLVHGRAQAAMMKLGHILRYLQRDTSDMPHDTNGGPATGAYLRQWLALHPEHIDRIRESFFQAVRLSAAGATTFASYLERQAGARWTTQGRADAFGRDWGTGSARARLMSLVFGGGALDDLWGDTTSGGDASLWFSKVRETSDDPRIQVLFNLARHGDALYLRTVTDDGAVVLDPASWEALYLETELGVRVWGCENHDPTQCTKDALRATLPAITASSEFLLQSMYGVTLQHAKKLSTMLYDAAVQHDMVAGDVWARPSMGTFHLSGVHSATPPVGRESEAGWMKLDKTTVRFPYSFEDRAQWGVNVCSPRVPDWHWLGKCTGWSGWNDETNLYLGALSSLAFAREVLFDLAPTATSGTVSEEIASLLASVERLTGKITAIRREQTVDLLLPTSEASPLLINPSIAGADPGLRVAARDPQYVGPNGVSRATLDAAATQSGTRVLGSGPATGIDQVSWSGSSGGFPWPGRSSLLLKWIGSSTPKYIYLTETRLAFPDVYLEPTATIATEGWFVDLARRVSVVSDMDWAEPAFDGFGLPKRWVPPADASLMGGSAGEESYTYLLRSAKAASEEATAAVKTAIDKLAEEARDELALQGAEDKAQMIGAQEQQALCGTSNCECNYQEVSFEIVNIGTQCSAVLGPGFEICTALLDNYSRLLDRRQLPEEVALALMKQHTSYTNVDGSEWSRIMIRIWNAARLIQSARLQIEYLAIAAGSEWTAAEAAVLTADAAQAAADAQLNQLEIDYHDQVNSIRARINQANLDIASAKWRADQYCDIWLPNGQATSTLPDYGGFTVSGHQIGSKDTAAGAASRCFDVAALHSSLVAARDALVASTNSEILSLPAGSITQSMLNSIAAQRALANAQHSAAITQAVAQRRESAVQVYAHQAVLTQTIDEREAALAELEQLRLRATQSKERAEFEVGLASAGASTNRELRRRYRSYDLWRARALLESARRLAATARRSIEARFVVDLSKLDAEQAFVASPSVWADEVYESDLNAPEVVGLSLAPKIEGAIYPNKLVDYVGNLERFVQGYTISYPTSLSLPDTEVITFGGPDHVEIASSAAQSVLSPDTAGWRFYCADQKNWIGHPGVGEFPVTHRLDTACNGQAPVLAKLGFWLDPWGVLNGSWTRPTYTDRHNVRWRRLAVNLVGTGIRDCSRANDSMSCYTNPFVRFNLVHAGASWQTNHAGEWRALDIPTASIEAGKALAAEEWLEPVSNSWNMPYVANVARGELFGRPAAGNYELVLEVTPDVRLDRIERIQLLVEQDYWVKQTGGRGLYENAQASLPTGSTGSAGASGLGGASGTGGATGTGGTAASGGTTSSSGTTATTMIGSCTPVGTALAIEGFEDGNKIIGSFAQRLGVWYGFHAGTCAVVPATDDSFVPSSPGNASSFAGHTQGAACSAGDWSGGGIGFHFLSSLVGTTQTYCTNYDASTYTGVAFDAKGNGEIRVEICTSDLTDEDCHGAYFGLNSTTWTRYDLRWSMLSQNGWGAAKPFNTAHLKKIQFVSKVANYSFDIDNIYFINN